MPSTTDSDRETANDQLSVNSFYRNPCKNGLQEFYEFLLQIQN